MNKAHSVSAHKISSQSIAVTALGMALVCLLTMLVRIPLPADGYAHLGNFPIFLFSVFFGPLTGFLAGGLGSAMADILSGFSHWALPTLIIKGLMGLVIALIARGNKKSRGRMCSKRTFAACLTGLILMTAGYFIAGAAMNGNIITGAAAIPGYIGEGIAGIVLFYAAGTVLEASGILKIFDN